MKIVVKPYIFLRQLMGFKEIIIDLNESTTVDGLLKLLRQNYGLPDQIKAGRQILRLLDRNEPVGLIILIDGRNIKQLQGTATNLHEGAVVALFPPAAGG